MLSFTVIYFVRRGYAVGAFSSVQEVAPEATEEWSSPGLSPQTRLGNFFWSACRYFGWLWKKKFAVSVTDRRRPGASLLTWFRTLWGYRQHLPWRKQIPRSWRGEKLWQFRILPNSLSQGTASTRRTITRSSWAPPGILCKIQIVHGFKCSSS